MDDLAVWEALFVREVDELPVQFVKPADTDRPTWAVYQDGAYLGTVSGEHDGGRTTWRVQTTREVHRCLDDAVRALRRPASWPQEREQAARWAAALLANGSLLVVDVETTGRENPYAVQIAVVDRAGDVLFNEYVRPQAVIEPAAIAVHGITPQRVATAATFGQLLPRLAATLHGRAVVAYNAAFDRTVFERELRRHLGDACTARDWLGHIRWHDAMAPYAVWHGLWSAKRGTYRRQPLGGPHDAVADCHLLLDTLHTMARSAPTAHW
ncbi:3'-5' exonuclease [Streptomyces sp. NPDC052013]|uniref:3'-5' exonuclease n=1 Tax=Streptomyces sp. NPDC052013 TaxID=3365679 RepID=UPI0037D3FE78